MKKTYEVCAIKMSPKEDIIVSVKASPKAAWEKAKEVTPTLEKMNEMEMPDVQGWLDETKKILTIY